MANINTSVQGPPDSSGKKLWLRARSIFGQTVHEQAVFMPPHDSYAVWSGAIAPAQNKHLISMWNPNGGTAAIRVKALFLVNLALTAISGVGAQMDIKRTTAQSSGTSITPEKFDSNSPAVTSGLLFATNATCTDGNTLWSIGTHFDEIPLTGLQNNDPFISLLPNYLSDVMPIIINPNSGLTVKCITNTIVGSFGMLAIVNIEPIA